MEEKKHVEDEYRKGHAENMELSETSDMSEMLEKISDISDKISEKMLFIEAFTLYKELKMNENKTNVIILINVARGCLASGSG